MHIHVNHRPLALVLQIGPNGKLVEPVLACQMEFQGGSTHRDVWVKEADAEFRTKAQELISEAIKIINAGDDQ